MDSTATVRQRLDWLSGQGEIRDGDIRYLMIRADALMGIFSRLEPVTRRIALESFCESIAEFGGRSAISYRERGAQDPSALLGVIADTAPQLGWGIWNLARTETGGLTLEVRNSPFVAGIGSSEFPVCAPIRGMLTAVAGMVAGRDMTVRETACGACGAPACSFTAE